MKNSIKIALGILVALIIVLVIFKFSTLNNPSPYTQTQLDDFAKYLTNQSVKMYGAYWCPHCINEKEMFGTSWQYMTYVECDAQGPKPQPALCQEKGISGYPTWEMSDGSLLPGELTLEELAKNTNYTLPTN